VTYSERDMETWQGCGLLRKRHGNVARMWLTQKETRKRGKDVAYSERHGNVVIVSKC